MVEKLAPESTSRPTEVDVVVVGAGFSGLYLLHKLRQLGFSTQVLEAADDVGGTWYWNRYPGARCDIPTTDYTFSFDPELEKAWTWSEKYAAQPEILRYAQFVADRYDLRRDIRFGTRVVAARWDDASQRWHLRTDAGDEIRCQHYVMATGCLSLPKTPDIAGADRFKGEVYFTSRWPHEGVDFSGKRVAVIGTGSSGIQSMPIIARQAKQLTVFQRTPNFSIPAGNGPVRPERLAPLAADRDAYRQAAKWSRAGVPSEPTQVYGRYSTPEVHRERFEAACALETALIAQLRETAPDAIAGDGYPLNLRLLAQRLKDEGHAQALPHSLGLILKGLAGDGRNDHNCPDGRGSITLKRGNDPETVFVALNRSWGALDKTAERRRTAAGLLLAHWLSCLHAGTRGIDLLAETTLGKLAASVAGDALLAAENGHVDKLVDRALLWLHEQDVLRLNKGLAVFRTAMTLQLESNWKLQFEKSNYQPLQLHYNELTRQIHIMAEYAERGIERMADALQLAMDYFSLTRDVFCQRWLPGREDELERQTTPQSWESIVETLAKPNQRAIVADDRDNTNTLVLAGPGDKAGPGGGDFAVQKLQPDAGLFQQFGVYAALAGVGGRRGRCWGGWRGGLRCRQAHGLDY